MCVRGALVPTPPRYCHGIREIVSLSRCRLNDWCDRKQGSRAGRSKLAGRARNARAQQEVVCGRSRFQYYLQKPTLSDAFLRIIRSRRSRLARLGPKLQIGKQSSSLTPCETPNSQSETMSLVGRPLRMIVRAWTAHPVYCTICGHANAGESVGRGESVAWCSKCQSVFKLSLFRVPGWITGVLGFLTVNLLCV